MALRLGQVRLLGMSPEQRLLTAHGCRVAGRAVGLSRPAVGLGLPAGPAAGPAGPAGSSGGLGPPAGPAAPVPGAG